MVVEERRVCRYGEQQRQQLAQPVANGDRTVRALDPDVKVNAPGVVALRDPLQVLLQAPIMGRVDDALVAIVGPGMGSGGRQRRPERISISVSISSPAADWARSSCSWQRW